MSAEVKLLRDIRALLAIIAVCALAGVFVLLFPEAYTWLLRWRFQMFVGAFVLAAVIVFGWVVWKVMHLYPQPKSAATDGAA